ncbi:MAG: glycosyltransferase family 4 protein [Flavobacterium sp.]
MEYLLILLILFGLELFYFKIADKYNIIDKPNHRSAHTKITLRGGGIVFWGTSLLYLIQHFQESIYFFVGISIMSLVSFWDDIQSLSNKIRLVAHFSAITLIFYSLNLFELLPVYVVVMAYVFFIGTINAYNFMDGINGITGLYTLVVFLFFWLINERIHFINTDFLIYPVIGNLVFLFFNFRKRAKCFAGDIGSIAIAFWVVYVLLQLMLKTNSLVWILFLVVYGVDAVCTILHRLYLKQNIFEAHRLHFYQILSNEYKMDHRLVATLYAVLQFIVSLVVINFTDKFSNLQIFAVVILPLLALYLLKFYLMGKTEKLENEEISD